MIHYTEIFPEALLQEMLAAKYVRAAKHPTEDLTLYSYSESAQYDRVWNACTRACRGLIVDVAGIVVARPFSKFFNIDEGEAAAVFGADDQVEVADKLDGSLGILYWTKSGEPAIATRGSFTSPQAEWATLQVKLQMAFGQLGDFSGDFSDRSVTRLYEVVYPANRIVVDYGDTEHLFYLGSIDIRTGRTVDASDGAVIMSYAEALTLPNREGAEGLVLRNISTDERLKIKQDDYKALHRIITQCSARALWEYVAVNEMLCEDELTAVGIAKALKMSPDRVDEIIAVGPAWRDSLERPGMPEAFTTWVANRIKKLEDDFWALKVAIVEEYGQILTETIASDGLFISIDVMSTGDGKINRKKFAELAAKSQNRAAHFRILDDQSITSYCFLAIYPGMEIPFASVG